MIKSENGVAEREKTLSVPNPHSLSFFFRSDFRHGVFGLYATFIEFLFQKMSIKPSELVTQRISFGAVENRVTLFQFDTPIFELKKI